MPRELDALTRLFRLPVDAWAQSPHALDQGQDTELSETGWARTGPLDADQRHARWLRARVRVPRVVDGYAHDGSRVELWLELRGSGVVYLDGRKVEEAHGEPLRIPLVDGLAGDSEHVVALELYPLGPHPFIQGFEDVRLVRASLVFRPPEGRPDLRRLHQELEALCALVDASATWRARHGERVTKALSQLDFKALEGGKGDAFEASLTRARETLEPLGRELKRHTVRVVGQSHIDMAWLWPTVDTVQMVLSTFGTAARLAEIYPDFTYSQSQAAAFTWVKAKDPFLFQRLQALVREGRFELVGGMWVEPDLNLPDGESIVRQISLGKRYFREELGADVRTAWTPDTFGYNAQLPQLYRKSGFTSFMTTKLAWNDTTVFPHRLFFWEGLDGSRLLTVFPNPLGMGIEPREMLKLLAAAPEGVMAPTLYLYGVGDHGGGPTREMVRDVHALQTSELMPTIELGTAQPVLESLANSDAPLPVWKGELYLETHRGVFTSHADMKRENRRSESLLHTAEALSAIAMLLGGRYPQEALTEAWRMLAFNQFHDILPGTSVPVVHAEARRDFEALQLRAGACVEEAISIIARSVSTKGGGLPVLVLNSLGWERDDLVELEVPSTDDGLTAWAAHAVSPVQVVSRDEAHGTMRVVFLAEKVPALGHAMYWLVPERPPKSSARLSVSLDSLENDALSVRVDRATGELTSVFLKHAGMEMLRPDARANVLQTFADRPREFDAWNLDADYEQHPLALSSEAELSIVESGPVRVALRVAKRLGNSLIEQDYVLARGGRRLEVRTRIDWQERQVLLKAAFPLERGRRMATYEIPFGCIERAAVPQTPEERAKFEVPALRWADLSDATAGVSLLNDGKYGHDAKERMLRLSLLRAPIAPDPSADRGEHHFTYALFPHEGPLGLATVEEAHALNVPLLARVVPSHEGPLPNVGGFLRVEPRGAIVSALKRADDSDDLVVRVYEPLGQSYRGILRVDGAFEGAVETNLLEEDERALPFENRSVALSLQPFEVKTLKLKRSPRLA